MKKWIFGFLFLALGLRATAQEGQNLSEDVGKSNDSLWNRVALQAKLNGNNGLDRTSNFEVSAGYFFNERLRLDFGYGNLDLTSKQFYVERKVESSTSLNGDYPVLDLSYSYWISDSKKHSLFVTSGVGHLQARVTYDYTRYREQDSGSCWGPCKEVEETQNGVLSFSTVFARTGLGYQWNMGGDRQIKSYNLAVAMNYLKILSPDRSTVGTSRSLSVGTDLLHSTTAAVALSLRL